MRDPMFIILNMLSSLLERVSTIISFIFTNYFPSASPEEPDKLGGGTIKK